MDLEKLNDLLPRGAVREIADTLGCSEQHVRNVLQGKYHNAEVLEECLSYAEQESIKRKTIEDRLNAL